MTIVAEKYSYVVGVGAHARTHTYAIINGTARTRPGYEAASVTTAARSALSRGSAGTPLERCSPPVEGTRSYGALTGSLTAEGIIVVEAKPPSKAARARVEKADAIDAAAAAAGILSKDLGHLSHHPQAEGVRTAISVLLASRHRVDHQRPQGTATLGMPWLVREIDTGKDLTDWQINEIGVWRHRVADTTEQRIAGDTAVMLAEELASGLQNQVGIGPVTTGAIFVT